MPEPFARSSSASCARSTPEHGEQSRRRLFQIFLAEACEAEKQALLPRAPRKVLRERLRLDPFLQKHAMQRLVAYDYPGNVRELRNMVERAIIISGAEPVIRPKHLALGAPAHPHATARSAVSLAFDDEPSLEEIEKAYLRMMLRKYGGHRLKVADVLDVSERSVYRMIEKYGLGDER